ncbi:hypothetical protein, partial [Chryseobacterium sp. Alg-005]|uniref:hypothetical protein n=1 Tax=Chryseobacterium sp. Alg-005 TaxID=3159516 RepID=UPI0036F32318
MRKIYLLLLFITSFLFGQNSQLYYSGIFLNHKNKPQNFLKVFNKNNGRYEFTDEEGFAIIAAKLDDTLTWNDGKSIFVVNNVHELKNILENNIKKEIVKNIYTKAYDSIISKKGEDPYSIANSLSILTNNSDKRFSSLRKLKQKDKNIYKLKKQTPQQLLINGNFTTSFDIKSRNSVPKTQDQYVQGRSQNGNLIWRGPETNEVFSFGPDISTLGYDHQPYEYDQNGRLIHLADAASLAHPYDNTIFKTTVGYNNQLKINAFIKSGYDEKVRLSIDLSQQKNQMYFPDQYDIVNSFKTKFSSKILKYYMLNFVFNYEHNKATNTNRAGLFTRAYQNSLLAPVSFSNSQGILLTDNRQRSYSQYADNPGFLFDQTDKYRYGDHKRQFSFDIARNRGGFRFSLSQAYENNDFRNTDLFKPSTYGFFNGIMNERTQNNHLYNSNISGAYRFGDRWKHDISLNFILNDRKSEIYNSFNKMQNLYQRTSQDYIFNYKLEYRDYGDFDAGINVGNSFYISNTSVKNEYWLPKINAYIDFDGLFSWYDITLKLVGAYTQLSSEPDITQSYSSYATTALSAENAHQYFPLNEVETFKNLSNIHTKEWKAGFNINKRNRLNLEAEYFKREITNDIFPVFENGKFILKNLADHSYSGYDLNLSYKNYLGDNLRTTQSVSFFKYEDIVNRVNPGYHNVAISGFKDIYKTLMESQPLGSVMGSYFQRNANGELLIDEFGYPVKAEGMKIIADPTPDFVMK